MGDIYHTSAITADQYLQGQVPGANVINRSGMPGSEAYVAIRGLNSISTTTQPLYLVDGIPVNGHGILNSNVAGYAYDPLSRSIRLIYPKLLL